MKKEFGDFDRTGGKRCESTPLKCAFQETAEKERTAEGRADFLKGRTSGERGQEENLTILTGMNSL